MLPNCAVYPDAMPFCMGFNPYGPKWSIIHATNPLPDAVTVHNSSTSWPGWAMTMPGPCWAVTTK